MTESTASSTLGLKSPLACLIAPLVCELLTGRNLAMLMCAVSTPGTMPGLQEVLSKCLSTQFAQYTRRQGNYQLPNYAHFGSVEAGGDRSYECSRVRLHPRSYVALDSDLSASSVVFGKAEVTLTS